ncbi:hypothetical protein PIB30_086788 [Stylosanthes scabra]|uniref:Uncharacterized protein n=1 Tax=Stylosanthes scabra TaxID=79078 RepID=A0ABU6USM1_9FABA|nr:hypothetical protein [Stylosanthes scabra]
MDTLLLLCPAPLWLGPSFSSSDFSFSYCNSPDFPLARYCLLCGFHAPPHGFAFDKSKDDSQSPPSPLVKTRLTRERYPHPYKECFVPLSNVGLTFHPRKGAQRPRWHTDPGSGSDTIWNSPELPLARYCPFCGFHAPPHSFAFDKSKDDSQSSPTPLVKTRLTRERYPHPYKECFVPPLQLMWDLHLLSSSFFLWFLSFSGFNILFFFFFLFCFSLVI